VSDYPEFGRFLAQQRQLRGLSREDVARSTRIPATLVTALEEGQHQRLPERVFVQHLIRAYSQVVGLSPDETIARWHEIPGVAREPEAAPAALEKQRTTRALKRLAVLVVAAVLGTWLVLVLMGRVG
jgi:cytoskeletal protein RodZ